MISGSTQLICLFGSPVEHSKSPAIHNTAFEALHLNYSYLAFDISKEQIAQATEAMRVLPIVGCNLTMPLKTAVIPYLDHLSVASTLCSSVNTITNKNGVLYGDTTDGIGYIHSLRAEGFHTKGAVMTCLGAGGAATSICTQAALENFDSIYIFKRKNATYENTLSFAKNLQKETNCKIMVYDMADTSALESCIKKSTLLVNATNVGMGDDTTSLVDKSMLHPDLFVSDIIYHPSMTTLLSDAKAMGCSYKNGSDMLLYQAAASFHLWTQQEMPIDLIREKVFSTTI